MGKNENSLKRGTAAEEIIETGLLRFTTRTDPSGAGVGASSEPVSPPAPDFTFTKYKH